MEAMEASTRMVDTVPSMEVLVVEHVGGTILLVVGQLGGSAAAVRKCMVVVMAAAAAHSILAPIKPTKVESTKATAG